MQNSTFKVAITEKRKDVFDVDILTTTAFHQSFDFIIYGQDNRMIRKGQFRGPSVQLRTSYMQEGNYLFQLLLNDKEYVNVPFQKHNAFVNA